MAILIYLEVKNYQGEFEGVFEKKYFSKDEDPQWQVFFCRKPPYLV